MAQPSCIDSVTNDDDKSTSSSSCFIWSSCGATTMNHSRSTMVDRRAEEVVAATRCSSCTFKVRDEPFSFNPMQLLTPVQLEAFNLLAQPIWILDFVERRNRWANTAALRLWEAENLDEFIARDLSEIMPSSFDEEERIRNAYHQVERGSCVEEQWTLCLPSAKAKAVLQMSVTGLRLRAEDVHCCMLCVAIPVEKATIPESFANRGFCAPPLLPPSPITTSMPPLSVDCQHLLSSSSMRALTTKEQENDESFRARAILQHLPQSVCQFDMHGKTIFQNPASLFAYPDLEQEDDATEAESVSRRSEDDSSALFPEDGISLEYHRGGEDAVDNNETSNKTEQNDFTDRFVNTEVARAALKTIQLQEEVNFQAEIYTANGVPQWSAIHLRKMKDPVTGKLAILFTSQDKTDAVEAKREREASIHKSEFLAIMAHEIRTPLHQVIGFTDLLRKTHLDSEQSSYVKLLKSSSEGLMTVISDVLDFSKLEAGQMKIERISYEPLSVLHGSMAAVRSSCEEKGLYLTMNWDKKIPFRIMGDPNRLRQVILNLLSNAIKFTKTGGIHVDVLFIEVQDDGNEDRSSSINTNSRRDSSSSTYKSWIKFVVTDTGCGIPKNHQKAIFEKYQQGNLSVARNYGGTGLGLSICQLLVQGMEGSLGVDSHVDHGSSFWVALPFELPDDRHSMSDDSSSSVTSSLEELDCSLNILLAEDNRINQKLMTNMFKRLGYDVTIAQNGLEAIGMVEKSEYDVVFMDIQMPVMDGLEATRRLRSMGYKDLPIYGLTASVKQSDFAELGFDDWLPKPLPMNGLKAKLHQLIKFKRTTEDKRPL